MKVICVGRNYIDHANELNNPIPTEPLLFLKPQTALTLPGNHFYYPEFTNNLQYECELLVKISKNGKFIQEKFAHKYYNAISLGIDFTARDVQERLKKNGLPWEIAKAFDGAAVVGEFLPLTEDLNIQNISFEFFKEMQLLQKGNTADMIFTVDKIISHISLYFSLNIGDIIFTGTPAGVGKADVFDNFTGYLLNQKVLSLSVK